MVEAVLETIDLGTNWPSATKSYPFAVASAVWVEAEVRIAAGVEIEEQHRSQRIAVAGPESQWCIEVAMTAARTAVGQRSAAAAAAAAAAAGPDNL